MTRVFLAASNCRRSPQPTYPLGMSAVAWALREAGCEVCCFDWLASGLDSGALTREVRRTAPDILMLSVRNLGHEDGGEGQANESLTQAKRVSKLMREAADAPLIIGGSAVSIRPRWLREQLGADCAVVGEGEEAAVELVRRVERGEPLPPTYRSGEAVTPEHFRCDSIEPEIARWYLDDGGMLGVQTKRGCPFRCSYCPYPSIEGREYRFQPPETVVDRIHRMHVDLGTEMLFIVDAVFNDTHGHFRLVAEELARRALPVRWGAFFTPAGLTDEDIRLCRRAGLVAAELGTDAASDTTLRGLGKHFDWPQVHRVQRMLTDGRIPTAHYIMFGGPGETRRTVREGLANIEALSGGVVFGFTRVEVLPGTPLASELLARGEVDADRLNAGEPVLYRSPEVEEDWLERELTRAWAGRADRVFPPVEAARTVLRLREAGCKGLLWDRLDSFP